MAKNGWVQCHDDQCIWTKSSVASSAHVHAELQFVKGLQGDISYGLMINWENEMTK